MQGWLLCAASPLERLIFIGGGLTLIYPGLMTDFIGFGLLGLALAIQLAKKRSGKYGPLSGQAA